MNLHLQDNSKRSKIFTHTHIYIYIYIYIHVTINCYVKTGKNVVYLERNFLWICLGSIYIRCQLKFL